jgi:hypothetical protein
MTCIDFWLNPMTKKNIEPIRNKSDAREVKIQLRFIITAVEFMYNMIQSMFDRALTGVG